MQHVRSRNQREPTPVEKGRRLSRFGFISYATAIVVAFFPGGAIDAASPWSGNDMAEVVLPVAFIFLGVGLNASALRKGAKSNAVRGIVVGLTLVPILAWIALLLSYYVFFVLL